MLQNLKDINSLDDPLKQFETSFDINLPSDVSKICDAAKLQLRAKSFDLPSIKTDETIVTWGGHERHYAGKQTRSGEWTVSFIEVYDAKILDAFRAWAHIYHDFIGGSIKLFKNYQKTIGVKLVNPSVLPESKNGYELELHRAWPVNVTAPQINASSSDPVDITVKFRYDYFLLGSTEIEAGKSAVSE